jgi:AAA15 family ATPase/GTPase
MLLRFVVKNTFSFDEQKEFNMLPNGRLKTLKHHIYKNNVLKLSSIYGANGAGKSNLIKSIYFLKKLVQQSRIPFGLKSSVYKYHLPENNRQIFIVEFIEKNTPFLYGIEFSNNIIFTEELYISGLGKKEDKLIFERKTNNNKKTSLKFSEEFEKDEKSSLLKSILIEDFIKPDELIIKLLSNRDNKYLQDVKIAYYWFDKTLQIISPDSKPRALAHKIETDITFKRFTEDFMKSFDLGIESLTSEKKDIYEFFGEDNKNELSDLIDELENSQEQVIGFRSRKGDEIVVVKEDDKIWVKKLMIEHKGKNDQSKLFDLDEESDGTIRLLDFAPAFKDITYTAKVFLIDEVERSIHPLLIKELIRKFSDDKNSRGQLIFTTHESNLLDQSIFRQDEIWFVEKNKWGATDLYSLSDFKEHKTIDIRKGYLTGRYGGIPFLANLDDLKWNITNASKK